MQSDAVSGQGTATALSPKRLLLAAAIIVVFIATAIEFIWLDFLPSESVYHYNLLALALGAIGMALLFGLNWGRWEVHLEKQRQDRPPSWWRNSPLFQALGIGIFAAATIQMCTMRLIPHLIVAAAGEPGEREFVVASLSLKEGCGRSVIVQGPPFLSNYICDVPRNVREKLKQGSIIIVHGKRNWAGLIPGDVRLK